MNLDFRTWNRCGAYGAFPDMAATRDDSDLECRVCRLGKPHDHTSELVQGAILGLTVVYTSELKDYLTLI